MAYLLALSDEILLAILSYFHNTYTDQPTLYRLSLVSRRLHALVSDRLLRKADLDGTSEKYGLFLRSIKENLHLGAKVHDLNLTWNDYLIKSGNPQELLVHLPNLRRLSIKVMQSYRLQSKFYLPPPSCSFYEMDIHLESPIHTDVCDLLLVDGIHHLKITIPRPNILPFVPAHKPHQAKIAPLQSFTVIGRTKISPYSLRNLLQYPTSLSHLSIPLPGGENFIHAGRTTVAFMNDPLSPGGDIARALAPAAFSLRSLEIHGHAQDFPGHDGTRLPLRGFTALQSAKLSSLLFFPPPEHVNTDPTGLYELLPPAIEEITVSSTSRFSWCYPDHPSLQESLSHSLFTAQFRLPRLHSRSRWFSYLAHRTRRSQAHPHPIPPSPRALRTQRPGHPARHRHSACDPRTIRFDLAGRREQRFHGGGDRRLGIVPALELRSMIRILL